MSDAGAVALDSLRGLALGDGFGERWFHRANREAIEMIKARQIPSESPWYWTDDTAMALTTVHMLHPHGQSEVPQVIRFTVTMPLPAGATTLPAQWTLLAVVDDPLLAAPDPLKDAPVGVSDLVLHHPYAAARSVQVFS